MDHQRMCTETKELEFRSLTILTFLQTSMVQSMAVSHKDISPVSQYDGLQVSVEYVEAKEREGWTSKDMLKPIRTQDSCDSRHEKHLHCYRSNRNGQDNNRNGAMTR